MRKRIVWGKKEFEKYNALLRQGYPKKTIAAKMGVSYTTLYHKIEEYNLDTNPQLLIPKAPAKPSKAETAARLVSAMEDSGFTLIDIMFRKGDHAITIGVKSNE